MTEGPADAPQSQAWYRAVKELLAQDRDSWAVQRWLMARGVSNLRLPRATVLGVQEGMPLSGLAFRSSASSGTTLSGASLAAHALTVHSLLKRKNIPVPAGREYSTGQLSSVKRFARDIGYPIVIRPANGALTHSMQVVASSESDIAPILEEIQRKSIGRVVHREHHERSVWIQKKPSGRTFRVLVAGDQIIGVRGLPRGKTDRSLVADQEVHPDLTRAAVEALRSIPGLDHGEVEMVATKKREGFRAQNHCVTQITPAPRFGAYGRDGDFGAGTAGRLVDHLIDQSGIAASEAQPMRQMRISYSGLVNAEHFASALDTRAGELGARISTLEFGSTGEDWATIELTACPDVGALLALAGLGSKENGQEASKSFTTILD